MKSQSSPSLQVLISGAAGNLGTALTSSLKSRGHHAIGVGRSKPDHFTGDAFYEADLSSEASVNLLFESLSRDWPLLNGAVFTTGGFAGGTLAELDLRQLEDQVKLNFHTAMLPAIQLFKRWSNDHILGRMVFPGSMPGIEPRTAVDAAAYGISKSMLFHFSGMINAAGQQNGIRSAVAVIPAMATPQNKLNMSVSQLSDLVAPETVAERIIRFLEGATESDYIRFS